MKNFLVVLIAIGVCYLMGIGVVQIINKHYQIGVFNVAMNMFSLALAIKIFKV